MHIELIKTFQFEAAHSRGGTLHGHSYIVDIKCAGKCDERLGWLVYPSQTNFVFAEPRDAAGRTGPEVAKAFYDFLCANKILVRCFPSHPLTRNFARISIGTDEEMNALLKTIDTWLRNAPPPSSAAPAKPTSS